MIADFIRFSISPNYIYRQYSFWQSIKCFFLLFTLSLIATQLLGVILFVAGSEGYIDSPLNRLKTKDVLILKSMVLSVFVSPIVEELAFRLHLRSNNLKFSFGFISLIILLVLAFFNLKFSDNYWICFIFLLSLSPLLFVLLNQYNLSIERIIVNNFKSVFYTTIVLFALIHLRNYELHDTSLFVMFLLITPQIIAGFFLGFIRMRLGFVYSIVFHSLHNSMMLFVFYLGKSGCFN
jgi:hypothetical protein